MMFPNATVTTDRAGTAVLTNRKVQLEFPTLRERMEAVGAVYDARIFDEAGGDWRQGDVVTLVAIDGFTTLPQVTKYRADLVLNEPGPLQVTEVQLVGAVQ
jgi:hypothetical protein